MKKFFILVLAFGIIQSLNIMAMYNKSLEPYEVLKRGDLDYIREKEAEERLKKIKQKEARRLEKSRKLEEQSHKYQFED